MQLEVRKIENISELDAARAVLHNCYIEEYGWQIPADNPSGLRIEAKLDQKILADDYDQLSTWFCLQKNRHLVGLVRLCHCDQEGQLEVERYLSSEILSSLVQEKPLNLVELNREAVVAKHINNSRYFLLLLQKAFQFCLENEYAIITTCNLSEWELIYQNINFPVIADKAFKYFSCDPEPVTIYFAMKESIQEMLDRISILLSAH